MNPQTLLFGLLLCCWLSLGTTPSQTIELRTDQDYALFFAVDSYEYMDDLQNPIQNAKAIAKELSDNFGFQTEVMSNPSLDDIDNKLAEYERKFDDGTFDQKGQLFLYFSGHGIAIHNNGYFMTPGADPARPHRTAMDYDFYRNKIDQIACQHIMVAIDACHSATFDPKFSTRGDRKYGRPGEREFDRILANHENYRSRVFWTSDGAGNETPDRSSFAYQLLEGLRSHQSTTPYLRSKELYTLYLEKAAPRPGGGSFGGDEPNSCFLFFRNTPPQPSDSHSEYSIWQQAKQTNTIDAYQKYLRDFPNGDFRFTAQEKITLLESEKQDKEELAAWQKAKTTDTPQAYSSFITEYPQSRYTEEARRRETAAATIAAPLLDDSFVRVEGGSFIMGCQDGRDSNCTEDEEKPSHEVIVSSFYLSKYEVTQAQWREVMGKLPSGTYNKGCDQCPIESVSWEDVQRFLEILNAQTWQNYRLPTEAEWEYAARGGNQSKGYLYSGSNDLTEVGWYSANAEDGNTHGNGKTTRPVGGKAPNELGLYDMSGNVYEWCSDWLGDYPNSAQQNPHGPNTGTRRMYRGGGWHSSPIYCRAGNRNSFTPSYRHNGLGFRLAHSY